MPKGYVLKQGIFPDILHRIANVINYDNIVSKANDGGVGDNNGKGKALCNSENHTSKGKAHDRDDHGNIGHPNGGSDGQVMIMTIRKGKEKMETMMKRTVVIIFQYCGILLNDL